MCFEGTKVEDSSEFENRHTFQEWESVYEIKLSYSMMLAKIFPRIYKGQLISKCLFVDFNFFHKNSVGPKAKDLRR